MLRNVKTIINKLNEQQAKTLNKLGFYHSSIGQYRDIKIDDTHFTKTYNCCGGQFDLEISIEPKYYFCGNLCGSRCYIQTPYDKWWCSNWDIDKFTKDMDNFQKELKEDIKELRKVGIIR